MSGNENIIGFDISVQDIVLLTELQSVADVNTDLHDLIPAEIIHRRDRSQGSEKLHTDIDIPSDPVRVLNDLVIFIAYDICVAFQL